MAWFAGRLGETFAILSVLAFAYGGVSIAKAKLYGKGDGGVVLSVVFTTLLSALVWAVAGTPAGSLPGTPDLMIGLAWFAVSGLLATALARILYFMSVRDLGAVRGSAVKRAIPFFAAVFGVLFLGETLNSNKLLGLALIAVSIAVLVAVDLARRGGSEADAVASIGYAWGTASALCYASAYVARKLGLGYVPDGALGTFVGSMAAVAYYAFAVSFNARARTATFAALSLKNNWAVVAALCFSIGQICNFYAIQHTAISTVGAIQSLEVFVSMVIATVVLRTEPAPGWTTIAAAVAATVGVLLVVA